MCLINKYPLVLVSVFSMYFTLSVLRDALHVHVHGVCASFSSLEPTK